MLDSDDDAAIALLGIDEGRAVRALAEYIRQLHERHSARGALMGLSGGLDSAVLASLSARALGADSVHAVYLYDRDSERGHDSRAELVARSLGIDLETESIESLAGDAGSGTPLSVRLARVSPRANRLAYRLYQALAGETPLVASLRAGAATAGGAPPDTERQPGPLLRSVDRLADEIFYARHRHRRRVLEARAAAEGRLLLGGANRSEWEIGWFVKGGVDDLPYQPLIGLYKTQVRQLARFLGVPHEIRDQAPSADMMRGISDEFAVGMSYETLDVALDHLAGGVSATEAARAGVTKGHLLAVKQVKELSEWKRARSADGTDEPPPPDGGHDGGLRQRHDSERALHAES